MKKERLILNKRIFLIKPFLYIVFLVSFASTAQNLVPNGSFEEYSECPEEREYNNAQFERCTGWWYPTDYSIGTPDYYNICNNSIPGVNQGVVGVPSNSRGYQVPYHGDGMVGFAAISVYNNENLYEGMEPISCKLAQPLKACYQYRFSCYLSLANISTHGIDRFGIILSQDSLEMLQFEDVYSSSLSWETNIVSVDTLNWAKIEGVFYPSGGEKFLTMGYFRPYEETQWMVNDTISLGFDGRFSYYFLDSVCLVESEKVEDCVPVLPNVFTPNADMFNDELTIEGLNIDEMIIFNRWGNELVKLTVENPVWDGTVNGSASSEGSYFYRAKFGTTYLTGFIELIR